MRIKWFSVVRIIGLVLVLLYHYFTKYFSGGFVGVDIFFTFSGYLITALFLDEFARNNHIDIIGFLRRRFYRILPPVILMVALSLPFTLLIRKDFVANIGQQIVAVFGFMTNYFEILTGGNYENQFIPHLFVHTWSLAVEVHFYVLWGLLVWWLSKHAKSQGQLRGMIFFLSSFIFLVCFLSMFVRSFLTDSFSTIYFSSWTHLFPFFVGSTFATLTGIQGTTKPFKRLIHTWPVKKTFYWAGGALTVLLLLTFFLKFENRSTYLFGFLFSSLATACLIFSARLLHEQLPDKEEPAIVTFLADTSYGVYLFHWPLYTIFSQATNNLVAVLLTTFFSLLFASLSFYILEPLLQGKEVQLFSVQISWEQLRLPASISGAIIALLGLWVIFTAPAIGAFETDLLTNSLKQADTQMQQTRTFADGKTASKYNVTEGTTVIGDSVTLRATSAISELLPNAIVDAAESRNTTQALEIVKTNIQNGTLMKNVVIATGVNVVNNYNEELDNIISTLPKGHSLIFVTPYDGNSATYEDPIAEKHYQYELELAKEYDFITIADWNATAKKHPEIWANSDNIHFGGDSPSIQAGAKLYVQTIQEGLNEAAKKPVKK